MFCLWGKLLLFFVLTTGRCNLNCRYCGGSFPKDRVPYNITYDIEHLKEFIEKYPDATVAFYGGEPLINSDFIEKVMREVKARRFVIQTNGILHKRLGKAFWNKMDVVLLSIDGRKETTDFYRGDCVYDQVVKAAIDLRRNGFSGDLIARMTISEKSDVYKDVLHLLSLKVFDHVHWQLDVGWSTSWHDFFGWCETNYKPGIEALLDLWISELEKGTILGIVPFLGILKRLREGGCIPPCGAGNESFAVLPNGVILACPIAYDAEWAKVGNITNYKLHDLKKVRIDGECTKCEYLRICGGRCLYMNKERLWDKVMLNKICEITKFTIDKVIKVLDRVEMGIRQNTIDYKSIDYPKFNNSTEIIP